MPFILHNLRQKSSLSFSVGNGRQIAQSAAVVALLVPQSRLTVMLVILVVSMIAVSFPAVSSSGLLRIPNLLFFIGKHFGTGVILATAFVHLLPDSFSSLLDKRVEREYGNVGKWVGLLILGSLLAIFLVEYVSTTFVDHLHAEPSAPSSPEAHTDILPGAHDPALCLPFLANTPKIIRLHSNTLACVCHDAVCVCVPAVAVHTEEIPNTHHDHSHHHRTEQRRVGRRRQIVSILVLQVGIMIHSLVIGLTLSVTSGADFTSLTTAIVFHQIFEGLSLGIRIAALPPAKRNPTVEDGEQAGVSSTPSISELEGLRSFVTEDHQGDRTSTTASDTLSARSLNKSKRSRPQLHLEWRALFPGSSEREPLHLATHSHDHEHHHYGSTSHSHTTSSSQECLALAKQRGFSFSPLKTVLSVLFAVTTPAGMALGLALWGGENGGSSEEASMKLTQGVMSAISAGMLIYAATVEMIAGDFVFGDLEGHHHHGGADHHGHGHEEQHGHGHQHEHGSDTEHAHSHDHHPSIAKRVIAVLSLLLGVAAMTLIGLGEPEGH